MARHIPLTDEDRAPWLVRVRDEAERHARVGHPVVVACSALKKAYRDVLRSSRQLHVVVVYLAVDAERLYARLVQRPGHFMKADMLLSQLATLEPPDAEPATLTLAADAAVPALVSRICAAYPGL